MSFFYKAKKPQILASWLAVFLIITAVLISYANSIDGTFHFDDQHSIQENESIRTPDWKNIWRSNNPYRFIGHASFALNYHFNGLEHVRGWHFVNIFLHILCALLCYLVVLNLMRCIQKKSHAVSLMTALLFAVHPLLTEPVNYIQARHVIFYTVFALCGALFTFLFLYEKNKKVKMIYISMIILSMILGALSKEVGIFYVPAAVFLSFFTFVFR